MAIEEDSAIEEEVVVEATEVVEAAVALLEVREEDLVVVEVVVLVRKVDRKSLL